MSQLDEYKRVNVNKEKLLERRENQKRKDREWNNKWFTKSMHLKFLPPMWAFLKSINWIETEFLQKAQKWAFERVSSIYVSINSNWKRFEIRRKRKNEIIKNKWTNFDIMWENEEEAFSKTEASCSNYITKTINHKNVLNYEKSIENNTAKAHFFNFFCFYIILTKKLYFLKKKRF